MREYKRTLDRSMRDLDRERTKLQQQEKKIIVDIKKAAKDGQMGAVNVMAKDLVRTRRYVQKFYEMKTQLQGVALRLQTVQSTQSMVESMRGVTKAMMVMNGQMNLPALQQIMMEFQKQNEMMDMKEEMVSDAIDDAMEDDADEADQEEIVNKVLDEIGISLNQQVGVSVGEGLGARTAVSEAPVAVAAGDGLDDDLQTRLNNLRNG